jgi:hypothetical protein
MHLKYPSHDILKIHFYKEYSKNYEKEKTLRKITVSGYNFTAVQFNSVHNSR